MITSTILFLCLSVLVLATQVESNGTTASCQGYMNPMERDGRLDWVDKWVLMDTAVHVHCAMPLADQAACETYMLARTMIKPRYCMSESCAIENAHYDKYQKDTIGRWRVLSFNDSACADPWAPDLNRASTVMAPRLLLTNSPFARAALNAYRDTSLGWDAKWDLFEGLLEVVCTGETVDCRIWFMHDFDQDMRKACLRLWSNVARKNAWTYDPWDYESKDTAAHLPELFRHPAFQKLLDTPVAVRSKWW